MSDFDFCQADSENDGGSESELEAVWITEELSHSEDDIHGHGPER